MKKYLFTNWPDTADKARREEFGECLRRNKEVFDEVYVLTGERTVDDLVAEANRRDGDINVIANADVWFGSIELAFIGLKRDEMYALTRYEDGIFLCRQDSADAWVFKGKIRLKDCPFRLGLRGSDNAIAARAIMSGYRVLNPSLDIRIRHIHKTRLPNNKYAPQPYNLHVPATTTDGKPVVFATSINPYDRLDVQKDAIYSWHLNYNTRILSFNTKAEIEELKKDSEFKDVIFIESSDSVEGKYVRLNTVFKALSNIDAARYILINSDISIDYPDDFSVELIRDEFILGVRRDVKDGRTSLFKYGYDVFAFRRNHLGLFSDATRYALGLPFWDFYIPLKLIKEHVPIHVERDMFSHQWHETRYDIELWRSLGDYSKTLDCFVKGYLDVGSFCTENKKYIENYLNKQL